MTDTSPIAWGAAVATGAFFALVHLRLIWLAARLTVARRSLIPLAAGYAARMGVLATAALLAFAVSDPVLIVSALIAFAICHGAGIRIVNATARSDREAG